MRALFTSQPGLGHLFPLLPVADRLRRRGHEVLFATSKSFAADVVAAGYEHVAAGLDWLTSDIPRVFPEVAAVPPGPERYAFGRRAMFAGRTAIESVPDLIAIAERWQPDLFVREAAEYGGCLAAELFGVPHAMVRTDSGSSSYSDRHVVGDALAASRHHVGLGPDPDVEMPFRYLQLSWAPPGLDEPEPLGARVCHSLSAIEARSAGNEALPSWLAGRHGRPTVYVTLGTVYNAPALLATIIEALSSEPLDLLVTVGPGSDPDLLGPHPSNVHVSRWLPQDVVLPHCAAVITHGGYGTVSAALSNAVPLVIVPISADQPLNASRCHEVGVSRTIGLDERTPEHIRAATLDVLGDPRYRRAAQRVASAAAQRPGLDHALDLLETLALDRVPLPVERCVDCGRGSHGG